MNENLGPDGGDVTMPRLVVRSDLGGYAATSETLASIAGVEIEKPFVLLCGPNGSGKTSLLRMMRAAMGLVGERQGTASGAQFRMPPTPSECDGDLGKLAAWSRGRRGTEIIDGLPGILDVGALGWRGQRSWLFDSRKETQLVSAGSIDEDIGYHVSMLSGGATRRSHGEVLRGGWFRAVQWALGMSDVPDPYDEPGRLSDARRELWRAVTGDATSSARPTERWLFLDEPEAALDMDAQMVGLSTLVRSAAVGSLRVFCASHSPLFPAGLADDPGVQVLDLGNPAMPWFSIQKRALAHAADPAVVDKIASDVVRNVKAVAETERKAAAEKVEAGVSEALKGLSPRLRAFVVAGACSAGATVPRAIESGSRLRDADGYVLGRRGLATVRHSFREQTVTLTALGMSAAGRIQAEAADPSTPRSRKKKAVLP